MRSLPLILAPLFLSAPSGVASAATYDAAAVKQVITRSHVALKQCYQRAVERDGEASGKLVVRFVVERDGAVGEVRLSSDTLGDELLGGCVVNVFQALRFGAMEGRVTISYPLVFRPAEG